MNNRKPKFKVERGGNSVKKTAFKLAMLTVSLTLIILILFNGTVLADINPKIEHVSHTVTIMYNGYILINDTVKLSNTGFDSFLLGFPYKYGPYILRCVAYDALNSSNVFPVTLNVPLENRAGFYGVKISFPRMAPRMFTVCFVLSNDLLIQDKVQTEVYTLDFPVYPSLTMDTDICNVSVVLPEDAVFMRGTIDKLTFEMENLQPFAYMPANVVFSLTGDVIQKFDVIELKREIKINEFGEIQGSDFYRIVNKAQKKMDFTEVVLPSNASNPTAYDSFGRPFKEKPTIIKDNTSRYKVSFSLPLETNKSTTFTVKYDLPKTYVSQNEIDIFDISLPLFQDLTYYVEQASVTFVLPEGSQIKNFEAPTIDGAYSLSKSVFEESVTINRRNVFSLDSFNVRLLYHYSPLWLSFRPTLWMWALTIVGCVVAVAWKRPKVPTIHVAPTVAAELHTEDIKSFLDAYEDKTKIISELESLEARVQRGRIPRRRYKVQRKTLETRLNILSKNIAELKMKLRAAGGQYADWMRQLEIAEAEINEVGVNIKGIEARHRRGELSLEAYRKLQADYQQRKEKAETTINGILLRLREEIR
jgi:hypothetical protein